MKNVADRKFPLALLSASNLDRLEYFKKKVISHDNLTLGIDKALSAVSRSCGPKVVMVTGPSGAGKSTLGRYLYKKLMEIYLPDMEADRGMVPVLGLNAIPPTGGCFNWKDFHIRLLEKHGDILLDRKMLLPRQRDLFPEMAAPLPIERSTTEALRRASERCMELRKTKILIIDEAHHILMAKDPARLQFQFETLKSLTIESDVIILLVGTYRLLDIRDQSGQLVRRSEIIHFPRYKPGSQNEMEIFGSVLLSFQKHLPLAIEPNLMPDVEYFFLKSAGCVGILKEWLTRCLEKALVSGLDTFDKAFAEEFALPNKSLMTIVEEAIEGELRLQDASLDALKHLMYQAVARGSQAAKALATVEKPAKKKQRRVGERNPVRDKVGVHHV